MSESTMRIKPLTSVAITGGTHGNELVGVYLVRHWMNNVSCIQRKTFNTHLNLNNPRAIEKCVRYIDSDLNRRFSKTTIEPNDKVYEVQRAREIQQWVLENNVEFLVDIHNTTSNMGVTLILTPATADNMLTLQIAANVKEFFDFPVRVLSYKNFSRKYKKGESSGVAIIEIVGGGIILEVGPVSHGTLKADIFQRSEKVITKMLDLIEEFNSGKELHAKELEVYEVKRIVPYPHDSNGNITALIHADLDGRDWATLKKGDAMFLTFEGETINYDQDEDLSPVFINEAAYMEKDIAFFAAQKVNLQLQGVQREEETPI